MIETGNAANFILEGKDPRRVALRAVRTDYTYGQLGAASNEMSARLVESDATAGDRILLLGTNSFHWIAAYLGILHARMICVPVAPNINAAELAFIVESTQPQLAVVDDGLCSRRDTASALATLPFLHQAKGQETQWFQGPDRAPRRAASAVGQLQSHRDLAALMFTSGSTGKPRGVMVTHRNIIANTRSIIASLHLEPGERMMAVLPFHYCFGTSLVHTYLRVGSELVIGTPFTYPEAVLQRMRQAECTTFAGVPSHYQILLRNSSLRRSALPRLRTLLQAGGHLAPAFLRELQEAVPQARIFVMYGQTEATARLACLDAEMLTAKSGSIGKAIPGVTLRLLDDRGEETRPGEAGEIVAEGENVTLGYWGAPEETALSFREGRLFTGDLATQDEDGYLYIVDRAKEFIKCGGIRIGCHQLEDRLLACEEIVEAVVTAVPDDVLGEAACAFVVPRSAAAPGIEVRLRDFCKAHFPRTMIPRDIILVHSLPKTSSGKVARWRLKAIAGAQTKRPPELSPSGSQPTCFWMEFA